MDQTILETVLLVDGNRGIYVPKEFADRYETALYNLSHETISILRQGPNHPEYWEAMTEAEDNAYVMIEGHKYTIYFMDGDLFAVPDGYEWPEC